MNNNELQLTNKSHSHDYLFSPDLESKINFLEHQITNVSKNSFTELDRCINELKQLEKGFKESPLTSMQGLQKMFFIIFHPKKYLDYQNNQEHLFTVIKNAENKESQLLEEAASVFREFTKNPHSEDNQQNLKNFCKRAGIECLAGHTFKNDVLPAVRSIIAEVGSEQNPPKYFKEEKQPDGSSIFKLIEGRLNSAGSKEFHKCLFTAGHSPDSNLTNELTKILNKTAGKDKHLHALNSFLGSLGPINTADRRWDTIRTTDWEKVLGRPVVLVTQKKESTIEELVFFSADEVGSHPTINREFPTPLFESPFSQQEHYNYFKGPPSSEANSGVPTAEADYNRVKYVLNPPPAPEPQPRAGIDPRTSEAVTFKKFLANPDQPQLRAQAVQGFKHAVARGEIGLINEILKLSRPYNNKTAESIKDFPWSEVFGQSSTYTLMAMQNNAGQDFLLMDAKQNNLLSLHEFRNSTTFPIVESRVPYEDLFLYTQAQEGTPVTNLNDWMRLLPLADFFDNTNMIKGLGLRMNQLVSFKDRPEVRTQFAQISPESLKELVNMAQESSLIQKGLTSFAKVLLNSLYHGKGSYPINEKTTIEGLVAEEKLPADYKKCVDLLAIIGEMPEADLNLDEVFGKDKLDDEGLALTALLLPNITKLDLTFKKGNPHRFKLKDSILGPIHSPPAMDLFLPKFKNLKSLKVDNLLSAPQFKHLPETLEKFEMNNCHLEVKAGFKELERLTNLRELSIEGSHNRFTADEIFPHLSKTLTHLNCSGFDLYDLSNFKELGFPNLQELQVRNCSLGAMTEKFNLDELPENLRVLDLRESLLRDNFGVREEPNWWDSPYRSIDIKNIDRFLEAHPDLTVIVDNDVGGKPVDLKGLKEHFSRPPEDEVI